MERVADVLGRKFPQFNTVSFDHLVSDALYQMCAENVDFLIVLENDRFSGIVTSSDVANRVLYLDKPLNQVPVREIVNTNLPVVTLDDSIEYCMQLLERFKSKFLAVYDHFNFKGVVTAQDIMQEALSKTAMEFASPEEQPFTWGY
ncbi:MAG TPA: CBS domain-containing protein [Chitinophagaceae bacterium]|jgi:CBS domain-containing protein|nr:CBS domain-containing protein [Chitinophagaceae bacterium]